MQEILGTSNRVLEVNLSTQTVSEFKISDKDREMYLGGKGMGLKLLSERLQPGIDPLSPDNSIAFMMGVYMGTNTPSSGRFSAVTKSPLTGIMVHSSCGGPFGMAYKTAGYDGLIVTGKAKKPTYLVITKDGVSFEDAAHLWGKNVKESQEKLKLAKGHGELLIGTAGENKVKYANVVSGHRFLGRGGIGAVMGSKNLKGIVAHGKEFKIIPKNQEAFKVSKKLGTKYINQNNMTSVLYRKYGTNSHVVVCNETKILPVRNFAKGSHKDASKVSGELFKLEFNSTFSTCKPCTIMCGHKGTFKDGRVMQIPEYETTGLFGPNLEIFDPQLIAEWNDLAGNLGLDTISLANTLGFVMEATEKGLMKTELQFGKADNIEKHIKQIAAAKGIGAELGNGTRWLSEKYGGKDFAIHVKGLEMAAYDPRGAWGQGLNYAVANRGACHLSAPVFSLEATMGFVQPHTTQAKAKFVNYFENMFAAVNSMHGCQFTSYAYMLEPFVAKTTPKGLMGIMMQKLPDVALGLMDVSVYSKSFASITGIPMSQAKMFKAGERIHVLERYMNTREGISRKDDTLPERFLTEARRTDPDGHVVPLEKMLNKYYKLKGYDENGIPTPKTMERLSLDDLK